MGGATEALDFTPSGFLSAGDNVVAGMEAATAALRAFFRPENPRAIAAGSKLLASFDDDLRQAVQHSSSLRLGSRTVAGNETDGGDWRWLAAVREASNAICDGYALLPAADELSFAEGRQRVARRLADSIEWNIFGELAPDTTLWSRLGELLRNESGVQSSACLAGDSAGVVREFIRALAYHSAALDQLPLRAALAAASLIQLSLPFLSLARKPASGPHYAVSPADAPVPRRQLQGGGNAEWYFVPHAATDFLAEFETRFERAMLPQALAGVDAGLFAAALQHLRRMWALESPTRRFRRHRTAGRLTFARGLEDCARVLAGLPAEKLTDAAALDLGRHGLGARIGRAGKGQGVARDELVSLRFMDGEGWHLGLVRRLSIADQRTDAGIEILSARAQVTNADDGEKSLQVVLCDPPERGEALRVIAAPGALRPDAALFVPRGGSVHKLKPLDAMLSGPGFELRVYQVL